MRLTVLLLFVLVGLCQSWRLSFRPAAAAAAVAARRSIFTVVLASSVAACTLGGVVVETAQAQSEDALVSSNKLFESSCAFCHSGGGNVLPFASDKTLFSSALAANGLGNDAKAIASLITNGKGAMPAFGPFISPKGNPMPARLTPAQIDQVAEFVVKRAAENWSK